MLRIWKEFKVPKKCTSGKVVENNDEICLVKLMNNLVIKKFNSRTLKNWLIDEHIIHEVGKTWI
jgi:hypothetical protein